MDSGIVTGLFALWKAYHQSVFNHNEEMGKEQSGLHIYVDSWSVFDEI